ncbi:hypothetical protein [Streptomyces mirabilis]|uniref:hypothetical protein n=1 Tax=Streptomyces mirabilis TaxID=68239 RepID=UPI0036B16FF5
MTPDAPVRRRRCAVVSLGARAQLHAEAPTSSHADRVDLAGFCTERRLELLVEEPTWSRPPVRTRRARALLDF